MFFPKDYLKKNDKNFRATTILAILAADEIALNRKIKNYHFQLLVFRNLVVWLKKLR